MSNTRRRRPTPRRNLAAPDHDRPRCDCRHGSEPDGRCRGAAIARVTAICADDECDCAVSVHLACEPCLSSWRQLAIRDGAELRIRELQ